MIFLLEYDRAKALLVSIRQFDDRERRAAEDARLAIELSGNRGVDREVVLLEAANEETIRKTHRRYFEVIQDLTNVPGSNGG